MDKQFINLFYFSNKNSESVSYAEDAGGSSSDFGFNMISTEVQLNQVCDRNAFQMVPQLALVNYAYQQFMLDMFAYVFSNSCHYSHF